MMIGAPELLLLKLFLLANGVFGFRSIRSTSSGRSIVDKYCRSCPIQKELVSLSNHRSFAIRATEDRLNDRARGKKVVRQKKKPTNKGEMMRYSDEVIKPWTLSDSFNSTTMRFLFEIKDGVTGSWAKVERKVARWILVLTSKIERDIKTTFKTGDIVTRKIKKESKAIFSGVAEVAKPLLSLPATIQQLSGKKDSWGLMSLGINPLREERMLGNFNAINTKERASLPKKKTVSVLAADSLYRSVKTLPGKLKYDYGRKKIAEQVARDEKKSRWMVLPDGSDSLRGSGQGTEQGRRRTTPLLPENIYSAEHDGDVYLHNDGQYEMEDHTEIVYSGGNNMLDNQMHFRGNHYENGDNWEEQEEEGEEEEEVQDMLVSEEEGEASEAVYQRLLDVSKYVEEGALSTLKTEMVWALTVAEEILDLEILDAGLPYSDNGEIVVNADGSEVKQRTKEEREMKQRGIDRVTSEVSLLQAAVSACSRIELLTSQIDKLKEEKERERTLIIREGDMESIKTGIVTFVGVLPLTKRVPSAHPPDSVAFLTGWSGGQDGVIRRIVENRPLLAALYGQMDGLEGVLQEQRVLTQKRYRERRKGGIERVGRRRGGGRNSHGSVDAAGISGDGNYGDGNSDDDGYWADDEGDVSRDAQVQSLGDDVPEGMIKESTSSYSEIEQGEEEKREEAKKVVEESVHYPPVERRTQPKAWSPRAAIKRGATAIPANPVNSVDTAEDETSSSGGHKDYGNNDNVHTVEDLEGNGSVPVDTASSSSSEENQQDTVYSMPEDDVTHGQQRYFLSVVDDASDSRGRGGGRGGHRNRQMGSSVFDTTAENSVRDSERAIQFLTTSLDVMFFLVETMVKTAGPIIRDGGAVAADRAAEALFTPVVSPKNFIRNRTRKEPSSDPKENAPVKKWKLLSKFKIQS